MAIPRILSLVLVHTILLSNTASATPSILSIPFSRTLAINSTDAYQIPVSLGASSPQLVLLTPSTNTDDTFVTSAQTCTVPGNTTPLSACVNYRGGVFAPPQSPTWKQGSAGFSWRNNQYVLFANGSRGKDDFALLDGDVTMKAFEFAVVDNCNMASGFLGLGRSSSFLARLVADKAIWTRSYGLHVGIDLNNHSYPIVDPTFGGSGSPDTGEWDSVTAGVHSIPGSLTLGGYDRAKIDNRGETLQAQISDDGSLELEVTNMVLLNEWLVGGGVAHDVLNVTRTVVIDSSTPYMYLPESTARRLSDALGAQEGEPGVDFFYGTGADKYIGNLTFTLRVPGGVSTINIVIPPSALYQPITALEDYVPTGDVSYDRYLPIKAFQDSSKQPIVLGRTFLKAAYLFVNHDTETFEVSQVAYIDGFPNLAVASDPDAGLVFDKSTTVTVPPSSGLSDDDDDDGNDRPPIAPIATAVGAGAVMCAFAIAFIFWRRRQSNGQGMLAPIPSSTTVNHYGNERDRNGTAMVNLPPSRGRDEKHPGGPGQNWGVWEKDGNGGCYMPHPLSGGGLPYETESDYVGMATTPTQAYPPRWAEFPPAHMHPENSGRQYPPDARFEMM